MKNVLKGKLPSYVLAVVAGLAVAYGAWKWLRVGEWLEVRSAIEGIAQGNNLAKARTALEMVNDRAYVLGKLEEATENDDIDIHGKANLLTTLSMFNQPRALRRALDSKSVTTERAACTLLYGDPEAKARCGEIALAWLEDKDAQDRASAVRICGNLELAAAQPIFLSIVQKDPQTESERALFQQALAALKNPKPPELVERLFKLASDPNQDRDIRAIALVSLQRMKDGPRDRIRDLSIEILGDRNADIILRQNAAIGLAQFPEDKVWQALEAVVLSDEETNPDPTIDRMLKVVQRNCLNALGAMEPADPKVARSYLDRLRKLLLDRRVYSNPYFAIKVDVATALCALNVREAITLDIMCDYLVDEDRDDTQHLVRQEGWLTLWTLTGILPPDTPQADLFAKPPPPFPDPMEARPFLFRRASLRPGISRQQAEVVAQIAGNLPLMQKTRQIDQGLKVKILDQWRAEEEAKKAKAESQAKPGEGPVPGNVGPQAPVGPPPPKEEEKGPGKEEKGKDG